MTNKILYLKSDEDLNEKIIKEKGNEKCIFYSDDICRQGDKTRDCINCARVNYRSLYSLNWDNQERLYSKLQRTEQENNRYKQALQKIRNEINDTPRHYWGQRHVEFLEIINESLKDE